MQDTYTYVQQVGNNILSKGYKSNGVRFNKKEQFLPTLFTTAGKGPTPWKTLYGKPMYEITPGTIRDCRDYIERYSDVEGIEVCGMTNWVTQFIADNYPETIVYHPEYTRVFFVDIETTTKYGFPDIETANEEILLITVYDNLKNAFSVYTWKPVSLDNKLLAENKVDPSRVFVSLHESEQTMLKAFVTDWATDYPDVLTGWHSKLFDTPYLCRRIMKLLGDSFVKKLSPWGIVKEGTITINGEENYVYDIAGVSALDYIDLFKKYTYGGRDSWKLDNVAEDELEMRKLEYDGSFEEHYTKEWNHFTAYNIIDVNLVVLLDKKKKLLDLAMTIAYDSKVNPEDVFSQIRSWDSLLYSELKNRHIVIPNSKRNSRAALEGGFVKEPIVGKHKWVVSFDLTSLYPHLMMWGNMSPETLSDDVFLNTSVEDILNGKLETKVHKTKEVALAANGACFRKHAQGIIPEIVERIYNDRSKFKKQMIELKKKGTDAVKNEIDRLDNLQLARKIQINSIYGACGSPFFRYYSHAIAEAITTSGQLAIRWVSRDINNFLNKAIGTTGVDYCVANDTDSVVGETEVYVNGVKTKIEDLYNTHQRYVKQDDYTKSYVKPVDGSTTLSINKETGEVEEKPIVHVMKHRVKKRMFKITIDNSSVVITEDHSLIVKRKGKIIEVRPIDVLETDKIINITTQPKGVSLYEKDKKLQGPSR